MKRKLARLLVLCAISGGISGISAHTASAQLGGLTGHLIVNIASPTSGAVVRNTTPVNAGVTIIGAVTVADVTFYVDGNPIGSDATNPYSVPWDTRRVGNGSHTLTASARDILGVRWWSNGVTVTVSNDTTPPLVSVNQASTQADPTSSAPIVFTAIFSEAVTGFTGADVVIGGTAGGTKTVTVSGGPSTYTVAVSGMTTDGTVIATIPSGRATDAAGNPNTASTSTDHCVTFVAPDTTPPWVSVNQASTQADPTSSAPIVFTAIFSEAVTGFTGADVVVGGTADGTKAVTVSGGPSTYTVAVSGMTTDGTVIAAIPSGRATDAAGNPNTSSTSTDNTVTFRAENEAVTRFEELAATYTGPWVSFSDAQTGVTSSNGIVGAVNVGGSTATFTFTGTGISWIGFPCEVCGIANVYLDDLTVPIATVDTFATTRPATTTVMFSKIGLTSGTHTLRIEVTGTRNASSGDSYVIVDAFEVMSRSTGSPDTTRFEEVEGTYDGPWSAFSDAQTGVTSSNGTVGAANVGGSTVTFTFTGTGISWIGFPCEVCGIANVYVDDVLVAAVDTFAPTRPAMTTALFSRTGLTSATHTLRIDVTGTKNASSGNLYLIVDAFDVTK